MFEMPEDGLDDLTKRRLQSELDGAEGLGARISMMVDSNPPSNGEFFKELHRRGYPEGLPERLLQWPMNGLINGAAGLLYAGLEIPKLFGAITKFYDAMIDREDFDIEEMFAELELSCSCASPHCPRSPHVCGQIMSALASCFTALEALLPAFDVPDFVELNPTDEQRRSYDNACEVLYKQYSMTTRTKVLAIIELNLIAQLKAGIIQTIGD